MVTFFVASVSTLLSEQTLGNSTLNDEEVMSQQRARSNNCPLFAPRTERTSGAAAWSKANFIMTIYQYDLLYVPY